MDHRTIVALGLLALIVVALGFTLLTLWKRGRIARGIADGSRDSGLGKGWPWYR